MRTSEFHLFTRREVPADAQIASHRLMLRTGMIRRHAAGVYTWSPLGYRVLRRVENVVREEMERAGALEMLMPSVQPAELWRETGRWDDFGPLLLTMQDQAGRDYCFGPTHEEIITDFVREELRSFKQLPVCLYQIQTKFRDEIRPRFGVMRAREFTMKDAYSFHLDHDSLERTYRNMHAAYCRIFERLGLQFRAVLADSGAIGGSTSHEFHVLADSGEDQIAVSDQGEYAANVELAEAPPPAAQRPEPSEQLRQVATPGARTIVDLVHDYDQPIEKTIKTLVVHAAEGADADLVALLVRGDHELNTLKAEKLSQVAAPLRLASEAEIRAAVGAGPGSLGPVELPLPMIADRAVAVMADFSAGANQDELHYFGVNWGRDAAEPAVADLRNVQAGDPGPDGSGRLEIMRGIEVGHIFQLGTKYSDAMGATVMDADGRARPMIMGCYGVGVSRIVAAAIEQNHDEKGIIWPQSLAPFSVALLPLNRHKSHRVAELADRLYTELTAAGVEVLLDDRPIRPGVMFNDMELIGIPHQVVIGERALDRGMVEYRRRGGEESEVEIDRVIAFLTADLTAD